MKMLIRRYVVGYLLLAESVSRKWYLSYKAYNARKHVARCYYRVKFSRSKWSVSVVECEFKLKSLA